MVSGRFSSVENLKQYIRYVCLSTLRLFTRDRDLYQVSVLVRNYLKTLTHFLRKFQPSVLACLKQVSNIPLWNAFLFIWSIIVLLLLMTADFGKHLPNSISKSNFESPPVEAIRLLNPSPVSEPYVPQVRKPTKRTNIDRLNAVRERGIESGLQQYGQHKWCCERDPYCFRPPFLQKPPRRPARYGLTPAGVPNITYFPYNEHIMENEVCLCEVGYVGQECLMAQCNPPCKHGGKCTEPDVCTCLEGWGGQLCEDSVCNPKCQHGQCVNNKCVCDKGYQGINCGLRCVNGMAHFGTCECVPGWVGKGCDKALCHQTCAHGSCLKPNVCLCDKGWTGYDCSSAVTLANDKGAGKLGGKAANSASLSFSGSKYQQLLRSKEEIGKMEEEINHIKQRKAWEDLNQLQAELKKIQKMQAITNDGDSKEAGKREKGKHVGDRHEAKSDKARQYEALKAELEKEEARLAKLKEKKVNSQTGTEEIANGNSEVD